MTDTIHRIVTERMIAALQRGTVPWRKPWQAAAGRPRSMSTGQPYRGVNVFLLGLAAAEEGYGSPFWGTYRQIAGLGGQVRKGERSTLVVFWKQAQAEHRDPQTGELTVKSLPVLRYYRVFNAAQADDLPDRFYPAPGDVHVPGDRADYHPATDAIRLPLPAQFRTPEAYSATAFHEAGHSTGHPTRLNRPGIAAFDHFGSGRYAREELVAQMTSALLCAQTGIDDEELFRNSASYIASWLTTLGTDHKLVITAAGRAQRACDLITQAEREPAKDSKRRTDAELTRDDHATALTARPPDTHLADRGAGGRATPACEVCAPADVLRTSAVPETLTASQSAAGGTGLARASTRLGDWQAEAG